MSRFVSHVNDVMREIKRFQSRVDDLLERYNTDAEFARFVDISGSAETGAVRRASLDLSRELVKLRKTN